MSGLSEKEKKKLIQEKCQSILTELLKDEDNKYCVDCDAKSPRWASWNLGILLCIRCAGIHRNLGVHISKVKSVNLDAWTPQQVTCIQQMGNSRARAVYEANLPDNFRRPQTDSSLEQFIRAKYEARKYIAKEWVQPPMPNPTWDLELEKQLRKKKERKAVSGTIELPAPVGNKSSSKSKNSPSPKPLPKAPDGKSSSTSPSTKKSSATQDLIGLNAPPATTNGSASTCSADSDPFGDFLTAAPATIQTTSATTTTSAAATITTTEAKPGSDSTKAEEESFFNQKAPEGGNEKLSKDSILALYGQAPQPQFDVTASNMYMGMAQQGIGQNGMMPAQQQQQQNVMFMPQGGVAGGGGGGGMPGMPNPFFSNGMPQGVPTSIQLSAANPFAQQQNMMANQEPSELMWDLKDDIHKYYEQMQNQMAGMSLSGGMTGPHGLVGAQGSMGHPSSGGMMVSMPNPSVMGATTMGQPTMGQVPPTSSMMGSMPQSFGMGTSGMGAGVGTNSTTLATNLWQ